MGKRIQQLLMIPLFFIASVCYSSTYFSYVEDIVKGSGYTYYYQMDYWKASSPMEPNPCVAVLGSKGAKNCYFSINHLHSGKSTGGIASRADWSCGINFANYPTMASIIEAAQSQCGLTFPRKGESRHSGGITTDECVGIFVGETAKKSYATILPGGICGIAPPPAGKCYFTSPDGNGSTLELNHGALNANELNGDMQTSLFYIICNQDMSVKVSSNLQNDDVNLRPDGSLKSHVTLNNRSAAVGIVQSVRENQVWPVRVESTLKTNGTVEPGKFSGRITLVLTIP